MIAWPLAILAVFGALFAALLVPGSHVIARGAGGPGQVAWFGFLVVLFLAVLGAGTLALLVLPG